MQIADHTQVILIVSFFFFVWKYLIRVVVKQKWDRVRAVARFVLIVCTIFVLVTPHNTCQKWSMPPKDSFLGAIIIASCELWSTYCCARCGSVLCIICLVYSALHAKAFATYDDNSGCDLSYKIISVIGLLGSFVSFAVETAIEHVNFDDK